MIYVLPTMDLKYLYSNLQNTKTPLFSSNFNSAMKNKNYHNTSLKKPYLHTIGTHFFSELDPDEYTNIYLSPIKSFDGIIYV